MRNYIFQKCNSLIPEIDSKIELYQKIILNYSNYETFQITNIFNEVGKDKSKRFVIPLYRELRVENHDTNDVGVIDVILTLTDDSNVIGDYKTGNPKYYELEWNPRNKYLDPDRKNYHKEEIDFELFIYYNLTNSLHNAFKVVCKDKITFLEELEFLNIKKGFVLYLNDWQNTFKYIDINKDVSYKLDNIVDQLIDRINNCYFERRFNNKCFDICPYINICIKDKFFKEREKEIDPFYKNKLDHIFYSF